MPGGRQGLLGLCRFELADAFPQLGIPIPIPIGRGLLFKKDGLRSYAASHRATKDDELSMTYDWGKFPPWYHRLFWTIVSVGTFAALWSVAIDFSAGAIGHGFVNLVLVVSMACTEVWLHYWEEREFRRWRSRENDTAAEEMTAGTCAPGRGLHCRLWLVAFSAVAMVSTSVGLLLAEVCVFSVAASHEQALSNIAGGNFPAPVLYSTQTATATLACAIPLGLVYYSCHWGPYIWMAKKGDVPPRVLWVTVFYDWLFCGILWAKLTLEAVPHRRDTMSYGMFAFTIVNTHFRLQTRALRTWGMPLATTGCTFFQDTRKLAFRKRMFALAFVPCSYYVIMYGIPSVVPALLSHGFEYPDEPRGLFAVTSFRGQSMLFSNFRSTGSWWLSERTDTVTAALAAADAPVGLRWWYEHVCSLPLVPVCAVPAWLCLPCSMLMIKYTASLVELWPTDNWIFLPVYAQVQYWVGIFAVIFDSVLSMVLQCHTLPRLIMCNWLGTLFNNFIASIVGNMTAHLTDPTNFEPEILEIPLALVGAWLTIFGALELSLDDVGFWIYMIYAKGHSLVVDTAPIGEMRAATRRPGRYPELFYRNFPFESVRACCVANQIAEFAVTLIVLVPVVPTWLRTRGHPHETRTRSATATRRAALARGG
jgi:hypothetical protein